MAFQRPGMSDFTGTFGANQGIAFTLTRDSATRRCRCCCATSRALPAAPAGTYPIVPHGDHEQREHVRLEPADAVHAVVHVGWQRKLGRDTAFELRYVGSRHRQDWETVNINEININANGFVNEFRKAQANLQANIAAGRGATFAYTGAPGTTPLPIFLAHFNGIAPGRRRATPRATPAPTGRTRRSWASSRR